MSAAHLHLPPEYTAKGHHRTRPCHELAWRGLLRRSKGVTLILAPRWLCCVLSKKQVHLCEINIGIPIWMWSNPLCYSGFLGAGSKLRLITICITRTGNSCHWTTVWTRQDLSTQDPEAQKHWNIERDEFGSKSTRHSTILFVRKDHDLADMLQKSPKAFCPQPPGFHTSFRCSSAAADCFLLQEMTKIYGVFFFRFEQALY